MLPCTDKRDFADVTKVKIFEMDEEFIVDYPERANLIICALKSEEISPATENQRDSSMRKANTTC